ncbi:hypothetical protein A7A09_013360 [Paracoccus methylarcula]|uniref:Uncharacterized protein n=1 Tax=Paracoccus methylarcula TaxID=72022 RepID=A0A3R7NWY4_9RHOB|nr:hypothetical protein A7A09_013360 [Paracoccus methylarcula]
MEAISYFKEYCLGSAGDLSRAIDSLAKSDSFGGQSQSGSGAFMFASFAGPNDINASVLSGASMTDDKCSIMMLNAADPLRQSEAIAAQMANTAGADLLRYEPFGDYGDGGFGYRDGDADIIIAPVTTGVSADIVHLSYYP